MPLPLSARAFRRTAWSLATPLVWLARDSRRPDLRTRIQAGVDRRVRHPAKPVVVQHSFGAPGSGGPVGALERILDSDLTKDYEFVRMHQDGATGSIDLRRLRVWATLLKETQPDLVHVRGLGNEGFHGALAARLAGCPRILVSVHGTARDLTGPASLKRRAIVTGLEPATLWMATHVTTVCESAARRGFVRRHAAKFVGPIVNGVEIPARIPGHADRCAIELDLARGRGRHLGGPAKP